MDHRVVNDVPFLRWFGVPIPRVPSRFFPYSLLSFQCSIVFVFHVVVSVLYNEIHEVPEINIGGIPILCDLFCMEIRGFDFLLPAFIFAVVRSRAFPCQNRPRFLAALWW
jgi:hypothetical protein